ncbi:MAG: response regulator [Pseudomonadota bacterium]
MSELQVLIVEDEPLLAMDLVGALEHLGYRVAGVVDKAEEAVDRAEEAKPDVVLMDVQLLGAMDGIEAAKMIRARSDMPIVFVTGHGTPDVIRRIKNLDPHGYLLKPFSDKELKIALDVAMYRAEMDRRVRESERKYQELVEMLPPFVFEIDGTARITFLNRSALEATGYTQEDIDAGLNLIEALSPQDRDRGAESIRLMLQAQGTTGNEYEIIGKNGRRFQVLSHSTPVIRDGRIVGMRGIGVDITEIKNTRRELEEACRKLETRLAEVSVELAVTEEKLRRETAAHSETRKELEQFRGLTGSEGDLPGEGRS